MKKTVAQRWVEALRSGKYKQGKHALKYKTLKGETRHCCLGVLCDLYQKDRRARGLKPLAVSSRKILRGEGPIVGVRATSFHASGDDCEFATLPEKVQRWAGMQSDDGQFVDGLYGNLARWNDDGWSFKKIANCIEENFKHL